MSEWSPPDGQDGPAAPADGVDASDIVRVVRGEPDEEELAALVAGILAAAAAVHDPEPEIIHLPPWTDHARRLEAGLIPGPTTWRWSLNR